MLNCYQARELTINPVTPLAAENVPLLHANAWSVAEDIIAKPQPPAVSFIARSGSGKTTLVTRLIAELKSRGYKVGAIKHGPPNFDIDRPGKDSYRFTEAGADNMLVCSDNKLAFVKQHRQPPPFEELLANYFPDVDIILVEGFKRVGVPKIEIHRYDHDSALLCRGEYHDPNLLAVATDSNIEVDVPQLDLNRPAVIVDFLLQTFSMT